MDGEDKAFFDQNSMMVSHTGSQMNQLITNSKPLPAISKVVPKKLTVNANKLLFSIPM